MSLIPAIPQVVTGAVIGGGAMYAVMARSLRRELAERMVPSLGIPKNPLPLLVERLETTTASFIRLPQGQPQNVTSADKRREHCAYLITDFSTRDGDIVRLVHNVEPRGYINRRVLESLFAGGRTPLAVLELERLDDEEDFVLTRHYPGPNPVPRVCYKDPEFGNMLDEVVYSTGTSRVSIWLRDLQDIENEQWYLDNESVLELSSLPREASHA